MWTPMMLKEINTYVAPGKGDMLRNPCGRTAEREVPGSATRGGVITKPLSHPLRMTFALNFGVVFILQR